jgi:hypothetical protein
MTNVQNHFKAAAHIHTHPPLSLALSSIFSYGTCGHETRGRRPRTRPVINASGQPTLCHCIRPFSMAGTAPGVTALPGHSPARPAVRPNTTALHPKPQRHGRHQNASSNIQHGVTDNTEWHERFADIKALPATLQDETLSGLISGWQPRRISSRRVHPPPSSGQPHAATSRIVSP